MKVSIRSLRKKDVDNLIFLETTSFLDQQEILRFDSDRLRKVLCRTNNLLGKTFLSFSRLFGWEPFKVLVAEVNGKVMGATIVDISRKVGYIHRVVVHPDFRRKGIATRLMAETLCFLRGKTRQAVLHVACTNSPAKALYRKLGFSKFENLVYLFAETHSLHIPAHAASIYTREASMSEYTLLCSRMYTREHLQFEISSHSSDFHLVSETLKGLVDRVFMNLMITLSEIRILAIDDDNLVGYAELSCTNDEEPARIKNIHVFSGCEYENTVDAIIEEGVNHMKTVGAHRIIALVSEQDSKLIQILEKVGFKRWLKMEGLILRFD